jgi:hypothetical protein
MKNYLLFSLYLLLSLEANSQVKGDYIWQLGHNSHPQENPYASSMVLDFNVPGIYIDTFYRGMRMGYFNASISDDQGKLLLYSNGCRIKDGNHLDIPETLSLSPGDVNYEYCIIGRSDYPVFESGLFLPFSNSDTILLLHQRLIIESNPTTVFVDSLFYTSVRLNNNQYELLEKTVPIVGDFLTDGNVEAVKSKKAGAWWVIQGEKNSNRYFTILLDSARVDTVFAQAIGDTTYWGSASGQAVFSPDGTMYARYNFKDDLSLCDFDRETGLLSNFRKMHVADSGNIGGLAFSPNGRFLYACSRWDMYQFDTWEDNIEASKVHLGHYDGYVDPFPAMFYHMQLGPDCRIYVGTSNGVKVWHIIHHPDEKGLACGFEQHGLHFPVSNSITMPNFPNYRLDIAPVCDPGIVAIHDQWDFSLRADIATMYPNPTSGPLTILLPDYWDSSDEVHIRVTGQTGSVYKEAVRPPVGHTISLGLEELPAGLYFISLHSAGQCYTGKVMKM